MLDVVFNLLFEDICRWTMLNRRLRSTTVLNPCVKLHFHLCSSFGKIYICGVLCDLVSFLQFKKHEKHPWRSVTFRAWNFIKSDTLPWVFFTLFKFVQRALYKSRNTSHLVFIKNRHVKKCENRFSYYYFQKITRPYYVFVRILARNIAWRVFFTWNLWLKWDWIFTICLISMTFQLLFLMKKKKEKSRAIDVKMKAPLNIFSASFDLN